MGALISNENVVNGVISEGDEVVILELKSGEKVAYPLDFISEGDEVLILKLRNGDKLAVKSRCIKIAAAFSRAVSAQYEIINLGNFKFYWNGTSEVYIGAVCQDITSLNTAVDDEIIVTANNSSVSYTYGTGHGSVSYSTALEISSILVAGKNTVNVQIRDLYGVSIGSTDLYMFKV